jgi:hypothetical protein
MAKPVRNVDGSQVKDSEDKPGCLSFLSVLILFPAFILEKLLEKIRRGRYWRMSDRDYAILQRKVQREKKREKDRNR